MSHFNRYAGLIAAIAAAPVVAWAADTESVVYAFQGGTDGAAPMAGLTDVGGVLYGTTSAGGDGTVFSVTATGSEAVVYRFGTGTNDGRQPYGGLVYANGALYGTTYAGGAKELGTVFKVTPQGQETLLLSFKGSNGKYPFAGLLRVGGLFYGVANQGGAADKGVVFSISKRGTEKVVYSFKGGDDGQQPRGGLIYLNGVLYGATYTGAGAMTCTGRCGSVYAVTPAGAETVLHAFQRGGTDGAWPVGALLNVDGTLYGTTYAGGTDDTGTVYSITPAGTEQVIYSFPTEFAGYAGFPSAGLIRIGSDLYGTALSGGKKGDGTVFKLTPDGTMKVLHYFKGGSDGAYPQAPLINVGGTLYGTTSEGGGTGCGGHGCGTVFKITR